jgi:hypothetical protein
MTVCTVQHPSSIPEASHQDDVVHPKLVVDYDLAVTAMIGMGTGGYYDTHRLVLDALYLTVT